MANWHPDAIRVVGESSGPHAPGSGAKILHHTTEGSTAAGAIGAYRATRSWPTFTLEWTGERLRIFQHMGLNQAARALANPPDAWETNRANVVQIEHVGFAFSTATWPDARCRAVGTFCRWVEAQIGCPREVVPGTKWGQDRPPRISGEAFHKSPGHIGHQHAPGNNHWDPGGGFRIGLILAHSSEPFRELTWGTVGTDVEALQRAVRARANACPGAPRRFRTLKVDGHYGERSSEAAEWAAWLLGVSGRQNPKGPLGVNRQELIREPGRRSTVQKARGARRRAKVCKGGAA
jgi:hypothetical protein